MGELLRFQSEISALATLLDKLLKVINHSDPSAKNMKVVLYDKYKEKFQLLVEDLKPTVSWGELNKYLINLTGSESLTVAEDARETVVNKLIKDFENEFVEKHQLSEFTAPDPIDNRQRERLKKIRKQIRNNRKTQSNTLNGNDIIDLMHHKYQQKHAKKSLEKLVKAFNKLDPIKNEN